MNLNHLVDRFKVEECNALLHEGDAPSNAYKVVFLTGAMSTLPQETLDITKDSIEVLVCPIEVIANEHDP